MQIIKQLLVINYFNFLIRHFSQGNVPVSPTDITKVVLKLLFSTLEQLSYVAIEILWLTQNTFLLLFLFLANGKFAFLLTR